METFNPGGLNVNGSSCGWVAGVRGGMGLSGVVIKALLLM